LTKTYIGKIEAQSNLQLSNDPTNKYKYFLKYQQSKLQVFKDSFTIRY